MVCVCENRSGWIQGQFDEAESCADCGRIIKTTAEPSRSEVVRVQNVLGGLTTTTYRDTLHRTK